MRNQLLTSLNKRLSSSRLDISKPLEALGMRLLRTGGADVYGDLHFDLPEPTSQELIDAGVLRKTPDGWHVATQVEADLAISLAAEEILRRGNYDLLSGHTTTANSDLFTATTAYAVDRWQDIFCGVLDQLHKDHPVAAINLLGILAKHPDPAVGQVAADLVFREDLLLGRYMWAVLNRCGLAVPWNALYSGIIKSADLSTLLAPLPRARIALLRSRLQQETDKPLDAVSGHLAVALLTTIQESVRQIGELSMSNGNIIKVLFFASNPRDTDALRLGQECRTIEERFRSGQYRDRVQFFSGFAARYTDVPELLLRHQPHIVHFSGHGNQTGEIVLEDDAGNARPISLEALAELLRVLKDNIRCVVLSACYSEAQARCLTEFVDCVVGVPRSIPDSEAIAFASGFYRAIAYGRNLQTAYQLGRAEIVADRGALAESIVLFTRP